jgi:hypothetical protein
MSFREPITNLFFKKFRLRVNIKCLIKLIVPPLFILRFHRLRGRFREKEEPVLKGLPGGGKGNVDGMIINPRSIYLLEKLLIKY